MATTLTLPAQGQPSPASVEVDVQLAPMDWYRAGRAIVWRQVRWLIAAAAGFVLFRAMTGDGVLFILVVGILGLLCFAIHSAFMYFGARSTLKTNRVLSGSIHYSFQTRGLLTRGPTFWGYQNWRNFHEILETRRLLILRTSSANRFVIPKRCLAPRDLQRVLVLSRARGAEDVTLPQEIRSTLAEATLLNIRFRMAADDLYRGFLTMLLRRSYWYAAQLLFAFALIFALNPRFLSPIAFVAVGSVYFLYLAIHLYRASAKAIRTNLNYQSDIEYSFSSSGIQFCGSVSAFHHDWHNLLSIIETARLFVFCPSNSQMLVVPKRAFADQAQIQSLREILGKHYSGKLSLKH